MATTYPIGKGPILPNDIRLSISYPENAYFGANGSFKIPPPLDLTYNTRSPKIVIADPTKNGSKTACLRWYAEVHGNKTKTESMARFQYLFPILIDPLDPKLFPEDGEQRIFNTQVLSIDNTMYKLGDGTHNEIQFVCYETSPLLIVYANIIFLAHPWFGVLQPIRYEDPARNDPSVRKVVVKPKELATTDV